MKHIIIVFVFLIVSHRIVNAQVTYAAASDFSIGSGQQDIVTCDVNGDGMPDIASASSYSNTVSVALNTTTPGASVPAYSAAVDFPAGTAPLSIAAADLNGDGKPDLAVANMISGTISVFLNTTVTGASTPSFSAKTDFASGSTSLSITFADLTGDGKPDMIVANPGDNTLSVLINYTSPGASTPAFFVKYPLSTGAYPYAVAAGDLNGDGRIDLASANINATSVSVLFNTTAPGSGIPSFSSKTDFSVGSDPRGIAIGDCNGDGRADLAVSNYGDNTISVLINTTAAGAAVPVLSSKVDFVAGLGPWSVCITDCNGDGRSDLFTANHNDGTVSQLINTTAPGVSVPVFNAKTDFGVGAGPRSIVVIDCNGDGKRDILTANYTVWTVSVLLNTTVLGVSPLTFSGKTDFAAGTHAIAVSYGDMNGDGAPDAVVANNGADSISVLLNTTAPGSSTSSYAPAVHFATGVYPTAIALVDLNGDGKKDVAVADYGSAALSVLFNITTTGDLTPSLSAKTDFATGAIPNSVAAGDFNNDGLIDLVSANRSGTISVLLNTTSLGWTAPSFTAKTDIVDGGDFQTVAVDDLNGDGRPDLSVLNRTTNAVSVFLNTTSAGSLTPLFTAKVEFGAGIAPRSFTIGEFNGDGKIDLAVANYNDNNVSVMMNTTVPGSSTPSFSAKVDFASGGNPTAIAAADCNGDHRPDIVTANENDNTMSVLLNTTAAGGSTPQFAAKADIPSGLYPQDVVIGDCNRDGKPDIIVANYIKGDVSVILNSAIFPFPVELVSFTVSAKGLNAELHWNTATEVNNHGFEVERKSMEHTLLNKGNWSKAGFVEGNGTSNAPKEYMFMDRNLAAGRYAYRLKQIDRDGKFEYSEFVEVSIASAPSKFVLQQNYPNPFNPTTEIGYRLSASGKTTLTVYDALGREVAAIVDEVKEAGSYSVTFDGTTLSSGIYFVKLQSGENMQLKKMILLR